ncbi:hypothetical protein ACFP65_00150 [Marinilactibacillus sp. GCM10026970]|uniref:hypothetical protein n=1 Tax=Marinilactibacillus sp. GCM10026970 TaxID=3252642 RepID=UPI00361F892A
MVITGMKVYKFVTIFSMLFLAIKIVVDTYSGGVELMDTDFIILVSLGLSYFSISQSRKKQVQKQKVN